MLPEHRAAVEDELARLDATVVAESWAGSPDLDRAGVADHQGIGGAPALRARVDPSARLSVGGG